MSAEIAKYFKHTVCYRGKQNKKLNCVYVDEPAKCKTRILRQINTADKVGMARKSCQYTMFQYSVQALFLRIPFPGWTPFTLALS